MEKTNHHHHVVLKTKKQCPTIIYFHRPTHVLPIKYFDSQCPSQLKFTNAAEDKWTDIMTETINYMYKMT
jgi:hypothetical protein